MIGVINLYAFDITASDNEKKSNHLYEDQITDSVIMAPDI